jgi:hypothetical protein
MFTIAEGTFLFLVWFIIAFVDTSIFIVLSLVTKLKWYPWITIILAVVFTIYVSMHALGLAPPALSVLTVVIVAFLFIFYRRNFIKVNLQSVSNPIYLA